MHIPSEKIRVAVLYGGQSGEHEISLLSAKSIMQHLNPELFTIVPIGIDRQGNWLINEQAQHTLASSNALCLPEKNPTLLFNAATIAGDKTIQSNATHPLFDVIFPAVHGTLCEDGTLQGLLEQANMPYVGCGVLASAIGMEKDISKRLARDAGILVPSFCTLHYKTWNMHAAKTLATLSAQLNFPVFVKPANTGSSVGVGKVSDATQLKSAIEYAFQYDTKIIIEQSIEEIIELEIAVLEALENNEPIVSIVGAIKPQPHHAFYSYAAKYEDANGAECCIPARVDSSIAEQAQNIAKNIFQLLECEGMARVDLFFQPRTGKIWFNEINTIPGFTAISMYPKLMGASGIQYTELLTHLIQLALKKHQLKKSLSREYISEQV